MIKNDEFRMRGIKWLETRPQKARSRCYTTGCPGKASLNHLLKQKGIISEIAVENHTYELRTSRFLAPSHYQFKRIGWEETLAMYGYCPNCDSKLFKSIEEPVPKISTKMGAPEICAYSLRPVIHEIGKKLGNIDYLNSDTYTSFLKDTNGRPIISRATEESLGVTLLNSIAAKLTQGLSQNSEIKFVVREIRRTEICASSILARPIRLRRPNMSDFLERVIKIEEHSFNIINIFPTETSTLIIASTFGSEPRSIAFQNLIRNADERTLRRNLSNVLINQIEDWAISERLYNALPANLISIIDKSKTPDHASFNKDHGIDLFIKLQRRW
jgi:hypothetical protein